MNRVDRLYAVVEELRAAGPRGRSARRLAEHFEVSVRTIERDILALQEAGVPISAQLGRRGGICARPLDDAAAAELLAGGGGRNGGRAATARRHAVGPRRADGT